MVKSNFFPYAKSNCCATHPNDTTRNETGLANGLNTGH